MRVRWAFVVVATLASASVLVAQNRRPPASFEQLTISTTAVGLSASTVQPGAGPPVSWCVGTLEGADVRYRVDGGNPTSTTGHLLQVGDTIELEPYDVASRFKAVRAGSVDATLPVTCYR